MEPVNNDDDAPLPGPTEPSLAKSQTNPLVAGFGSVLLTLVVGSAVALLVVGVVGLLLSWTTDSSGPGIALVLLFLVLPLAALVLVVPSAMVAVRLTAGGDQKLHRQKRVGLIVACLLSWAVLGLLVGVAVDYTGELTPSIAVFARDFVWWAGPLIAVSVLWWQAARHRYWIMFGAVGGWLLAALVAITPTALHLQDPARSIPLATIDEAVLAEREWTVEAISDRLPHQVNIRFDAEQGSRDGPEYVTVRFFARAPSRYCSGSGQCEQAGMTTAGYQTRAFTDCDAGSYRPRPGLLVDVGDGAWLISQMGQLACGDQHPDLTVEELVAFSDLLDERSSKAFREWSEAVKGSD